MIFPELTGDTWNLSPRNKAQEVLRKVLTIDDGVVGPDNLTIQQYLLTSREAQGNGKGGVCTNQCRPVIADPQRDLATWEGTTHSLAAIMLSPPQTSLPTCLNLTPFLVSPNPISPEFPNPTSPAVRPLHLCPLRVQLPVPGFSYKLPCDAKPVLIPGS